MSDTLHNNAKDGSVIPVRFTRLYITMLAILTVLLTVGQGLTQWRFGVIEEELGVVRHTALQRHQSQQIVKQVLQVTDASEQESFGENVAELRRLYPVFERYHLQTREGHTDNPEVTITYSDAVQRLYADIRPQFEAFQQSARRMMRLQRFDEVRQPDVQASLRLMLANEKPFLEKIDRIVVACNSEVRAKLTVLRSIELYSYGLTLLTLLGIGLLIFRPAARKLKQTFSQLIEAESQTTAANKKLVSAYQSLKETRQKLFEATKLQYEQQINEQKVRTSYLIAGQEEERKRLSRELHDGLGQMLTAIKLQLEGLEAGLAKVTALEQIGPTAYTKNLKTLKSLVTQTIQETRTISNNLMPTVLSDFGVVPAITMVAEQDRSGDLEVTFETNLMANTPRLDRNVEIMLYRVTQEAVSNAVRHANPSHIHIELMERDNLLQLLISDNGRGFRASRKNQVKQTPVSNGDPVTVRPPSQGLHNMQERVKLLNGKFKVNSTLGKGTKVLVSLPYQTHSAYHGID